MAESQRLREAIFHTIEQTSNDLRVQQDATNFDFRKRHYEMKRAKEELEYQMKAVGFLFIKNIYGAFKICCLKQTLVNHFKYSNIF